MTYQTNCTLAEEILEQIATEGLEALPELIRVLINEAMRLERDQHLGIKGSKNKRDIHPAFTIVHQLDVDAFADVKPAFAL